eukprot:UN00812
MQITHVKKIVKLMQIATVVFIAGKVYKPIIVTQPILIQQQIWRHSLFIIPSHRVVLITQIMIQTRQQLNVIHIVHVIIQVYFLIFPNNHTNRVQNNNIIAFYSVHGDNESHAGKCIELTKGSV